MIDDRATEKWKERMRKLGLIVNAGTDKPRPKPGIKPKAKADSKAGKKGSNDK